MAIIYVDIPEWCEHCGVYSRVPHLRDCPLTILEDFARVVEAIELALAVQTYGDARETRGAQRVFAATRGGPRL